MLWETGNSWTQRNTVKTCSYDNTDCYEARTVPVIFDISQNTGYLTGGQNLTVRGFGFNHKKIDVKIDGAPCTVTRYMDDKFDCQVSSKAEISKIDTPQLGQHGVKRSYWKGGNWKVDKPKYSTLHTNMETYHNSDDSYSSQFKGWFIAPATTKYRFYMSCDDYCELNLGLESGVVKEPKKILNVNRHTDYRFYRG